MRRLLASVLAAAAMAGLAAPAALAAGKAKHPIEHEWSFAGPFGTYDRAQLQRGFQVYKQVCSSCHGLGQLSYRHLGDPGGPEFSPEEVKAIAAGYQIADVDSETGEPIERPATPADRFKYPFANPIVGRATYGVYPPDLSVMAKARKGDADYIVSLLLGYYDPEKVLGVYKCTALAADKSCKTYALAAEGETGVDGLPAARCVTDVFPEGPEDTDLPQTVKSCMPLTSNYNAYFPGGQIAMPNMLGADGLVEYADGTPNTQEQMAKDVAAFLMWTAEPKMEARKRVGVGVILFLVILSALSYLAYRRMWRDVAH